MLVSYGCRYITIRQNTKTKKNINYYGFEILFLLIAIPRNNHVSKMTKLAAILEKVNNFVKNLIVCF